MFVAIYVRLDRVLTCWKAKWVAIFGYCIVMVITTAAQEITQAVGVYCQSSLSPRFAQIWVRAQLSRETAILAGLTSQPDHSHPERGYHCRHHKLNHILCSPRSRNGSSQTISEVNKLQAHRRREFHSKCMSELSALYRWSLSIPFAGANILPLARFQPSNRQQCSERNPQSDRQRPLYWDPGATGFL
jgi:hypothetical protein